MKKRNIILSIFAAVLVSCDSYLKEDSADLLIPASVTDYIPVLRAEAYPTSFSSQIGFVNLMTDDVEMGPLFYDEAVLNDKRYKGWAEGGDHYIGYGPYAHRWQNNYSEFFTDRFWSGRYSNILGCNTIIQALPEMTYAESEYPQYRKLAAQAYALRAYNYFCLVNTYALPWSAENLNKPGVVIRKSPEIEVSPRVRSTIEETYRLINSDISKAQEYIVGADAREHKYEMSETAIYFLATRIALFQEDWDGVIAAGEKFLAKNRFILDLNTVDNERIGLPETYENNFFINLLNNEDVIFAFGESQSECFAAQYMAPWNYSTAHEFGFHTSWENEDALIPLYDKDDLRLKVYFILPYWKDPKSSALNPTIINGQYRPLKFGAKNGCYNQAWRTSEVYLNIAEAYARKNNGVSKEAVELLNQLRIKKYVTGSPHAEKNVSDFTTKDELVKFIWQERRRELCFEELTRFWDMRRQGMPAVEHRIFDTATNYTSYRLPQGSANYVLHIPEDEAGYNNALVNNQREHIGEFSSGTIEK